MKIKSIALVLVAVCLVVGLCACGGNTPADDSTTTTTTTTTTTAATTTTTTTAATTTTTTKAAITYTVKVVDEAGAPIPSVMVQWCLETCLPGITDAQGIASLSVTAEADYKVSVMESSIAGKYTVENNEFYYDNGSYEMTIVLKAA